jgi:hypothetical protein
MKLPEKYNAIPIENSIDVINFCSQYPSGILYSNHKERFEELWGRWNYYFCSEYRHYIWCRKYKDNIFYVWSGKRGTSIEIEYEGSPEQYAKDTDTIAIVKEFIDYIAGKVELPDEKRILVTFDFRNEVKKGKIIKEICQVIRHRLKRFSLDDQEELEVTADMILEVLCAYKEGAPEPSDIVLMS